MNVDATLREICRDCLAGFDDACRCGVAVVPIPHGARDGVDEMRWRHEAELIRITDIQIADPGPGRFDLSGLGDDISNGVREAVHALRGTNRGCSHTHREDVTSLAKM
jgi:hypothetical protein